MGCVNSAAHIRAAEAQILLPRHRKAGGAARAGEEHRAGWRGCGQGAGPRGLFDAGAFIPENVGLRLARRYRIVKMLGSGSFGSVHLAEDLKVQGRVVAIKQVASNGTSKDASLRQEVRILKRLDHPNICKLMESYYQSGCVFLVLEACEGGDVLSRIMDKGYLSEDLASDIFGQVTRAMKYSHARGIAHRDLKPDNICFSSKDPRDTHVKVIDWGVAVCFKDSSMCEPAGSMPYCAPEVSEATGPGPASYTAAGDLWSLGATLYVMLCGLPPFWGSTAIMVQCKKTERYPMSEGAWKSVSNHAKELIRRLMKADPDGRISWEGVLAHPWLRNRAIREDPLITRRILQGIGLRPADDSGLVPVCAVPVARHLDHQKLHEVSRVFRELDANDNGLLELSEVKAGFAKLFSKDSIELQGLEQLFALCDLDQSGALDYTEFCAAYLQQHLYSGDEHHLRIAFAVFDSCADGHLTKDGFMGLLQRARANHIIGNLEEVVNGVFTKFDLHGRALTFEAWRACLQGAPSRREA